MCSDRRSPRSRPGRRAVVAVRRLAFVLAIGLAAAGCGNKRPPKPPPRMVPLTTTDLEVVQRGDELQFAFGYPDVTISGLPLPGLEAVELWRMTRPMRRGRRRTKRARRGPRDDEDGEPSEEQIVAEESAADETPPPDRPSCSGGRPRPSSKRNSGSRWTRASCSPWPPSSYASKAPSYRRQSAATGCSCACRSASCRRRRCPRTTARSSSSRS